MSPLDPAQYWKLMLTIGPEPRTGAPLPERTHLLFATEKTRRAWNKRFRLCLPGDDVSLRRVVTDPGVWIEYIPGYRPGCGLRSSYGGYSTDVLSQLLNSYRRSPSWFQQNNPGELCSAMLQFEHDDDADQRNMQDALERSQSRLPDPPHPYFWSSARPGCLITIPPPPPTVFRLWAPGWYGDGFNPGG